MILPIALALLLAGPAPADGVLVPDADLRPPDWATFRPDDPDAAPTTLNLARHYLVRHESEPFEPQDPAAAFGRRVTLTSSRARPDAPGEYDPGLVLIRGGMAPNRFQSLRDAADALVGPPEPLITRGLAHPRYAVRSAARDVMVRRGGRSIGPLVAGLASDDPEVRDRCQWALEEIRTGTR